MRRPNRSRSSSASASSNRCSASSCEPVSVVLGTVPVSAVTVSLMRRLAPRVSTTKCDACTNSFGNALLVDRRASAFASSSRRVLSNSCAKRPISALGTGVAPIRQNSALISERHHRGALEETGVEAPQRHVEKLLDILVTDHSATGFQRVTDELTGSLRLGGRSLIE